MSWVVLIDPAKPQLVGAYVVRNPDLEMMTVVKGLGVVVAE